MKVVDPPGNIRPKGRRVKAGDFLYAGAPGPYTFPEGIPTDAEGTDYTHSRYRDFRHLSSTDVPSPLLDTAEQQ
jgi:hypothetical protein